jgi:biotin carboxylase
MTRRADRVPTHPIGILYEHPDWFRPLFAELDRRRIPYEKLSAGGHLFDPSEHGAPFRLLLNRMSPSAHLREGATAIHYTSQYLRHLERLGVRVVNGREAWSTEISKAAQLTLLEELGLPYPRTRVIHDLAAAPAAAEGLRFPVVVKPNVGGSGAGVVRFETPQGLAAAAGSGALDGGIDGTALVQEFIPARDGRIVRVEVLGGRYLYAIRIYAPGDRFNLCPADVCRSVDGAALERSACPVDAPENDLRVEGYEPPPEVRSEVERIAAAAGIEVGGVEYLVDDRDGRRYYYDVNALSNFVADARRIVGFDPFARLVDWLQTEALSLESEPARPRADGPSAPALAGEVA